MKTFISIILFILLSFNYGFCQQLNWVKEDTLRDSGYHFGNCVSTDGNNNIYTSSIYKMDYPSQTQWGTYVTKRNSQGKLIWRHFMQHTEVWGLATDKEGNSYLSGGFFYHADYGCGAMDDSSYYRTFFVEKIDSNGQCVWSKMVHGIDGGKMTIDKSGNNIYIIGQYSGTIQFDNISVVSGAGGGAGAGQYIAKYTKDGNCVWVNQILAEGSNINAITVNDTYIAITGEIWKKTYFGHDSSAFALSGYTPARGQDIYTALYDLDGNLKWAKVTGDNSDDVVSNSIALDASNNVYVTGNFYDQVNLAGRNFHVLQYKDIFIVKYNEVGDTVMTTTWAGINSEEGRAIYANKNGIYFSGRCNQQLTIADTTIYPGTSTIVLAKLSFDLKHVECLKTFSSPGGVHSEILQITSDSLNNIIASGDYTSSLQVDSVLMSYNNSYYKKPFIISLKELSPIVLSLHEKVMEQYVFKVYPNPTPGLFQISFNSSGISSAVINIIDAKGQTIYLKVFQQIRPNFIKTGSTTLTTSIDLSKETKGIYFIEIIADDKRSVQKIVLD
jgi:hypothetical protein